MLRVKTTKEIRIVVDLAKYLKGWNFIVKQNQSCLIKCFGLLCKRNCWQKSPVETELKVTSLID